MIDRNTSFQGGDHRESGNAVIITLMVLIICAVGAAAVISGKIKVPGIEGKGLDIAETTDETPSEEAVASTDAAPAENPNTVLARVDGKEITRQDVLDFINSMPPQVKQMPVEQLFPMALEQLVGNQVVDKKLASEDLANDAEVKKQIAIVSKQIMRAKFIENAIAEKMTDERVQAEYEQYVASFPKVEEVAASHILVDNEELAKQLIKKLDKGADFVALAKENSKDGSAVDGGDLGYFAKTDVVPAFADAAFGTDVNSYTKKPVKSEFGYHIIFVKEKRMRPHATFEEAKPYLEQEIRRVALEEVIAEWKSDSEIERFDLNGNPLPEQEPAAGDVAAEEVSAAEEKAAE